MMMSSVSGLKEVAPGTTPKLSIVIPVFNSAPYVADCLDSILRQSGTGLEVVMVDDGSTDGSLAIMESYRHRLSQVASVKIISQENAGPGAARNVGIRVSRGAYVGFLDSDDMLCDVYVSSILQIIDKHSPDLIEFPYKRFTEKGSIDELPATETYGFSGIHCLDNIREKMFCEASWFPSTRVYRRSVADGIVFPEGIHYEDLMAIPFVFLRSLAIYFHDQPLLFYRLNPGSITSQHTERQLHDVLGFFTSIDGDSSIALQILKLRVARTIVHFFSEIRPPRFQIQEVLAVIRRMELPVQTVSNLLFADRFFYRWPGVYSKLESVRIPVAKCIRKCSLLRRA